jgi:chemotaxis protein CheD
MSEILVRVAEYQAARPGSVLVTLGLGSCVAVALHDTEAAVGGLAHVLLPSLSLSRASGNPGRFPQTAVPLLAQAMAALGADQRNVVAVRAVLGRMGIPVIGELVGGSLGRSVWFDVGTGQLSVRSVGAGEHIL